MELLFIQRLSHLHKDSSRIHNCISLKDGSNIQGVV